MGITYVEPPRPAPPAESKPAPSYAIRPLVALPERLSFWARVKALFGGVR